MTEYKPHDVVPQSGIYAVIHDKNHRQAHEITCVKGDHFPPCPKCGEKATFRLKKAAQHLSEHPAFHPKS